MELSWIFKLFKRYKASELLCYPTGLLEYISEQSEINGSNQEDVVCAQSKIHL